MRIPYVRPRHRVSRDRSSIIAALLVVAVGILAFVISATSASTATVAQTVRYVSDSYIARTFTPVVALQRSKQILLTAYIVRSGDTLTSIALSEYGSSNTWPALWWVNRHAVSNPNSLKVGEQLVLSNWHPQLSWLSHAALKAIPAPPPVVRTDSAVTYSRPTYSSGSGYGGGTPGGSFGACVVSRESGGNAQVMNGSGHYGLYQFSASTWAEYGGNPADFGDASVAEQEQVFANAMAQGGEYNWSPYDGC